MDIGRLAVIDAIGDVVAEQHQRGSVPVSGVVPPMPKMCFPSAGGGERARQ